VFIVVSLHFIIDSVRKLWDTHSYVSGVWVNERYMSIRFTAELSRTVSQMIHNLIFLVFIYLLILFYFISSSMFRSHSKKMTYSDTEIKRRNWKQCKFCKKQRTY